MVIIDRIFRRLSIFSLLLIFLVMAINFNYPLFDTELIQKSFLEENLVDNDKLEDDSNNADNSSHYLVIFKTPSSRSIIFKFFATLFYPTFHYFFPAYRGPPTTFLL